MIKENYISSRNLFYFIFFYEIICTFIKIVAELNEFFFSLPKLNDYVFYYYHYKELLILLIYVFRVECINYKNKPQNLNK